MNETLRVIHERRSCRAYKNDPIPEETLAAIVDAGLWAPTGMNRQDRHFTIIRDKATLDRMNKLTSAKMPEPARARLVERNNGNPDISVHYFAPVFIILSGGESSCSIAAENICIAAQSLGIGSCIIGLVTNLFDSDSSLTPDLKIPNDMKPRLGVALGYAAREMSAPDRLPGQITYL
jgi:nitroreductase